MINIEIEDSVYQALKSKIKGFGEQPNDVIKRLLFESESLADRKTTEAKTTFLDNNHPLVKLVSSPQFLRENAKERYFAVLKFLYEERPQEFAKLDGFKKGSRVQISTKEVAIKGSGRHTWPQKLYDTPYWILSNLSNDRKRVIIEDILRLMGYGDEIINIVLKTI